jgi:hypothetical protein
VPVFVEHRDRGGLAGSLTPQGDLIAEWKDEIAWMSLYFSAAVWASLALCVFYSLADHLPH